jgi:hypothetical protein
MTSISDLNDFQLNAAKNSDSQNSFPKKGFMMKDIVGSSSPLPDHKGSRCFRSF